MEKRREPRGNKEKEILRDSSFRRLNFKPLQEAVEVEKKEIKKEEIVEELSELEKDILGIAEEILKGNFSDGSVIQIKRKGDQIEFTETERKAASIDTDTEANAV